MEFRTEIRTIPVKGLLAMDKPVLMLGSCFSDNIGAKLRMSGFDVTINPFGALYNPASIDRAVECLASGRLFGPEDVFLHNGIWHSPMHHSRFSSADRGKCLSQINSELQAARKKLPEVKVVFVTLGTTRVFADIESGEIVANCHKLPAKNFTERFLDTAETKSLLQSIVMNIRKVATDAAVIFTVSPVRHTGYGLQGNALSKATLIVSVYEGAVELENVMYFPAYEIMMDDLRDYRFYASDMKHLSDVAIDYIHTILSRTYMTDETLMRAVLNEREAKLAAHRPILENH